MTWNPLIDPVDYVLLAGQRSPGLATIEGFKSPRRWDERRGYGLSGATVIFRGIGLARGFLVLRLFEDAHFEAWEAWRSIVERPPAGERAHALDISHPLLDLLGVRSVVVEEVAQPEQTADGEWTIRIALIEYRRPEVSLARPDGSSDGPADARDLELEALRTQFDALAAEVPG